MCFIAAAAFLHFYLHQRLTTYTWLHGLRSSPYEHDHKSRWDVRDPAYLTKKRIDYRTPGEPGRLRQYCHYSPIHLSKEPSIHATIYLSFFFLQLSTSFSFQGVFFPGATQRRIRTAYSVQLWRMMRQTVYGGDGSYVLLCFVFMGEWESEISAWSLRFEAKISEW